MREVVALQDPLRYEWQTGDFRAERDKRRVYEIHQTGMPVREIPGINLPRPNDGV
jgi:hypothetical protein